MLRALLALPQRDMGAAILSWWYGWATRSRLPEMISVAATLKRHFNNIITYIKTPITNATSESINSKIQKLKIRANGYRSASRFADAIMFHCGGMDLYPTHHNS